MIQPEIIVCKSREGLTDVFAKLKRGPLAVDTETTGLEWWEARDGRHKNLVGTINVAAGRTAVVALGNALAPFAHWLSDQVKAQRTLVFHHAKFDMHHLRETFGLRIPYPVHDTAVESFLVDNRGAYAFHKRIVNKKEQDHRLKSLAKWLLDPEAQDHEDRLLQAIRARGGKHKGDWGVLLGTEDEHLFTHYSALDPWYTLGLHKFFLPLIINWRQPAEHYPSLRSLYETERWAILAFRDMEEAGILVDQARLAQWTVEQRQKLEEQHALLVKLAGKDINWNSTPQLRQLLYEEMGIRPFRFTDSGAPSTDQATLLDFPHEIGPVLVKYREHFKQHGSYGESLPGYIAADGAIHPTFRTTGAETGRTSCADPNLQQQTRTSGIREIYIPRPGTQLRFADYSQVEMRFAGHFSNEGVLIDGFNKDPDFDMHGATAQLLYGHPPEEGTQQRKFAKILNFTKIFGGGENKINEQLVMLLSKDEAIQGLRELGIKKRHIPPGITPWRALAQQLIQRMNTRLPNLIKAIRDETAEFERNGYVMNAFGQHRYIDPERGYKAFNTKVQGTAAQQAKKGLVALYRELQVKEGSIRLLLQIHDENVYESDGDPAVDRRVLELMQDLDTFKVPIIADMSGTDKNWQVKKKIKLEAA